MPDPIPLELLSTWLAPVRDKLPEDLTSEEAGALMTAVTQEALARLNTFMIGIRAYQQSEAAPPAREEIEIVWQQGTTRLLDYAPSSSGPVVFVVPSLVNRFAILDIDQDCSFLRYLADQGLRPLVVDWDEPGDEEKEFDLDAYMTVRLEPMLDVVQRLANGQGVHLLGYCMGGVLALALALRRAEDVTSLALMATPWDFSVGGVGGVPAATTPVGRLFLQKALEWQPYFEELGTVPPALLQMVLTGFQPLQILQKFMRFAALPKGAEEMRRFVLTEDWLNDGVALTTRVAQECLRAWYANNALATLSWKSVGEILDPRALSIPTYVLIPQHDRIVPPESALPLTALIKDVTLHQPATGHIGLMAGTRARDEVWAPYVTWLRARTQP